MRSSAGLCILPLALCACADVDGSDKGFPDYGVIAHRGLSGHAPEETRVAYELARDLGADWLEGDVQRTSDGVLVLVHDDDLKRTSDVEDVFPDRQDENVAAFTFAELQQLDFGSWFNDEHADRASDEFVGAGVVSVDDLVDVVFGGDRVPGLYLETKSPQSFPGIEDELIALLGSRGLLPDPERDLDVVVDGERMDLGRTGVKVVVQSFDLDSLARFFAIAPRVPRVVLFDTETDVGDAVAAAGDLEAEVAPIGYRSFGWDISAIHGAGKVAHPWVINEGWQLDLVNGFGADGVFTDFAERALAKQGRGAEADADALLVARGLR